jgi:hypothetical protein
MRDGKGRFVKGSSAVNKGRKHTKQARKNMSEAHKANPGYWKGKTNPTMIGEKNINWKEKPGYGSIHDWVRRLKGKADHCEACGTTKAKKYEYANIDHKYRRVLDDYIPMCASCHRQYDKKRFGKVGNNQWTDWTSRIAR